MEKSRKQEICAALLGISVAVILWITILSRKEPVENSMLFQPLQLFRADISGIRRQGIRSNLLGNILLFIPVGFLFPAVCPWGGKWYVTAGLGLAFSAVIETVQLITARGYFALDDMLLNTLGATVGFILLFTVRRMREYKKR